MHSFYSPANAIYEVTIGLSCLATLFICVISVPTFFALMYDSKEQKERQNS
jgi:hypothetical protein